MSRRAHFIALCLGFALLGALKTAASASELTIRSRLSETVEYSDNYQLLSPSAGSLIGSYSTLALNALQRTPTTRFELGGTYTYRKYFGPGADALPLSEPTGETANARFERTGKTVADKEFIAGSYRRTDTSLLQRADVGFGTITGDTIILNGSGGISRQLTHLDTVSLFASGTNTSYNPSDNSPTPFTNVITGGSWAHRTTPLLDLVASSDATFLIYDNAAQTRTTIVRAQGGFRSRVNNLLTVSANGGASFMQTRQDATGAGAIAIDPVTGLPSVVAPTSGTIIGSVFDASVRYRYSPTTDFTLLVSQGVTPGALGNVSTRQLASASMTHRINRASTFSLLANYTHVEPSGTGATSTLYSAGANYLYRFTSEWSASLAYTYRIRTTPETTAASGTSAHSNSVRLTVVRDATLKP